MTIATDPAAPTRGERNHNPFDLEHDGTAWQGLAGTDGPFCVFRDDASGLRAGFLDLHTAWRRGARTVRAIVTRYAPPSENDTTAYIAAVVRRMNMSDPSLAIAPLTVLDLDDSAQLRALGTAMIAQEQGRVIYADAALDAAVAAALAA